MPVKTIHRDAPGAIPADVNDRLIRFGLTLRGLLTTDRSNPKLRKGKDIADGLILHQSPARQLARMISPDNQGSIPSRSFQPSLLELAEREGLTAAARAHNGCPWATSGCAMGCLNFAGHGGLSPKVAACRGRRSLAMLAGLDVWARAVLWATLRHHRSAVDQGRLVSLRLRGTDEGPPAIGWHHAPVTISTAESYAVRDRYGVELSAGTASMASRLKCLPSLRWHEYSKAGLDGSLGLISQRQAGDHITASFAADRITACRDGISALSHNFQLAIPVRLLKGDPLPSHLTIVSNGAEITVPAIDGDQHDHRWSEPDGVAVILRTKKSRGADPAVADPFSLAAHDLPQHLADGTVQLIWPD